MALNELRTAIREIIAEELVKMRREPGSQRPGAREEAVSLGSDAELDGFVRRIVELSKDSNVAEALRSGRRTFRLQGGAAMPAGAAAGPSASAVRLAAGIVTEATVAAIPEGSEVELDEKTRLTPLAQDEFRRRRLRETGRGK